MAFSKARGKQFVLAGPLAVAVTAFMVTACGGGGPAGPAPGSSPGQWTQAEMSKFTAASGADASSSQDSCAIGYFERDMSFGNAMAIVAVDPASGPSKTAAQVKTALVSKYGASAGGTIDAQFQQTITDSNSHCSAATAPASAPAASAPAASAPAASPTATSEASCTVDCTDPVATGESGWLAQVQGALQNVQQDLSSISSDSGSDPENLTLDGSQLEQDAQAALDPNYDPPPADNADWTTAMNDFVTAGEDYSGDNVNSQDDTAATAAQEINAGNAALASFNAANGGVLNGTIQS